MLWLRSRPPLSGSLKASFTVKVRTHNRLLEEVFLGLSGPPSNPYSWDVFQIKFGYLLCAGPALSCFFRLFDLKARVILYLTTNHLPNILRNEVSCIDKCSRFLMHILKVSVLIFKMLTCLNGSTFKIYHASLDRYSCFLKHYLSHHNGLRSLLLMSVSTLL